MGRADGTWDTGAAEVVVRPSRRRGVLSGFEAAPRARIDSHGIDAPEGEQLCQAEGHDWPCGQVATAAVYETVGGDPVSCEVYGRDRWGRALAECIQAGQSLNAAIVRTGWALAWYPATGAVLGPRYDDAEAEAADSGAGMWRGQFVPPWVRRAR